MPQESSPAIAALVKALEALPGYGPRNAQPRLSFSFRLSAAVSCRRLGKRWQTLKPRCIAVRAAAPGAKGRSAKSAQIRQETHRCSA